MDSNNKKQNQSYARAKACPPTDYTKTKSTDLQSGKPPLQRSSQRRREQTATVFRNETQRNSKQNPQQNPKSRPNVDKRPRPRGGTGMAATGDDVASASTGLASLVEATGAVARRMQQQPQNDFELNSIYAPGSKKQNLNHLLNFHYAPRESDLNMFGRGHGVSGGGGGGGGQGRHGAVGKAHKYNKEQFLQANFQFVINCRANPKLTASPDALIDWQHIEQINIQTSEEPQCPICLETPVAAKLTRCGHVYCWPCILHYLALSDKAWRKCPICYEAVHKADLKSTSIVQQRSISIGDAITFNLMRRQKGSMFIEKCAEGGAAGVDAVVAKQFPQLAGNDEAKLFSKFLIAGQGDILGILNRELSELSRDEDFTCPEYVFVQEALNLLGERREKVGGMEVEVEKMRDKELLPMVKEKTPDEAPETVPKEAEETVMAVPKEAELTIPEEAQTAVSILEGVEKSEAAVDEGSECHSSETHSQDDALSIGGSVSEDLESVSATTKRAKFYHFYQSNDGQNVYLHPMNVKMLQACYGSLDRAPHYINGRILQQDHHSMDEDHRRKFTCLGHLPLTCQFSVVEIDLQPPIVSGDILKVFREDIQVRKLERQRRDREERKREKKINEINDRQMGKLIASTAHLNLDSAQEFPTCGFEDFLHSNAPEAPEVVAAPVKSSGSRPQTVSYSAMTVVGGSPTKAEFWPTLAAPTPPNNNNYYQVLSSWGKSVPAAPKISESDSTKSGAEADNEELHIFSPTQTTLSDVLAEAISKKRQKAPRTAGEDAAATPNGGKKNRKSKKMQPLFSTGMNYAGN